MPYTSLWAQMWDRSVKESKFVPGDLSSLLISADNKRRNLKSICLLFLSFSFLLVFPIVAFFLSFFCSFAFFLLWLCCIYRVSLPWLGIGPFPSFPTRTHTVTTQNTHRHSDNIDNGHLQRASSFLTRTFVFVLKRKDNFLQGLLPNFYNKGIEWTFCLQ